VPAELADRVARLREVADDLDIVRVAIEAGREVETVARLDYRVGDRFGLDWLRNAVAKLPMTTHWDRLANAAILDDLDSHQTELTRRLLATGAGEDQDAIIDTWIESRSDEMQRMNAMLGDLRQSAAIDLAHMAVANRQFRTLLAG
jgi:glutamate dehydrogenase